MTTNIATTREQSARLRQCGVDPETCDMFYTNYRTKPNDETLIVKTAPLGIRKDLIPAWSLSALLALLPERIEGGYWLTIQKCSRGKNAPVYYGIAYFKCKWDDPEDISSSTITTLGRLKYFTDRNLIEAVCKIIEWLTANNYKLNQL
ncbi:hypothetical protein [Paramuribaculum intestinale]|uniref:hypothetical protein n=1 Tax=Paramuribaculum intestinale TaxID=2094151 RepID=UPI0025A9394C|nr:hypothetical protein [Paramuribaculum intestinale]